MLRGFVSAMRTLTALSVPGRDAEQMTAALPWFSFVGALLGAMLYGLCLLLDLAGFEYWPEATALGVVALTAVLTRGMHLDGLADAADGLFSMTDKARTLEIMKDSRIGTFGVLALIGILAAKWIAVLRLVEKDAVLLMVPALTVSRAVMADLAVSLPYAREAGGTGAPFVRGAETRHKVIAWTIAALVSAVFGPLGLGALICGFAAAKMLGRYYRKRLDGVTGDLLGAACELVEAFLLLLGAWASGSLVNYSHWKFLPI